MNAVKKCIQEGEDVNQRDKSDQAAVDNIPFMKLFSIKEFDFDVFEYTPLIWACSLGHLEIAKYLGEELQREIEKEFEVPALELV